MVSRLTPSRFLVHTGRVARRLRERASLNQTEAARRYGCAQSKISEIEADADFPADKLFDMALVYGLSNDDVEAATQIMLRAERMHGAPVLGNVRAGPTGLLAPLTRDEARELPDEGVIFIRVPDDTMADELQRGEKAMVSRVSPARLPGAVHDRIVYIVYRDESPHGEPEFVRCAANDEDSILVIKSNPSRGIGSRLVRLDEIQDVGIVQGSMRPVNTRVFGV
jgi:hypothetical protein